MLAKIASGCADESGSPLHAATRPLNPATAVTPEDYEAEMGQPFGIVESFKSVFSEKPRPRLKGAYALHRGWWIVFGLTLVSSIVFGCFSLAFAGAATKLPKLWQGSDFIEALENKDLSGLLHTGKWSWVLVGAATGFATGVLRVVIAYPVEVHGLMAHLSTQHCEWQHTWKTCILTFVSQLGCTPLGPEAGVAAAACGLSQYFTERFGFGERVQKACLTNSVAAVFGALFPCPIIGPLMIAEAGAIPQAEEKMALFALNASASLLGFMVYVTVMGYPYLTQVSEPVEVQAADTSTWRIALSSLLIGIVSPVVIIALGYTVHSLTYLTRIARSYLPPAIGTIALCTVGGLLYGLIMMEFPLTMGTGHEYIGLVSTHPHEVTIQYLALTIAMKMLSFAVVQAFGFEGGPLFCPICLGVYLGVLIQKVLALYGLEEHPTVLAAAGMAGATGGGFTPFTNTVMSVYLLKVSGHFSWVPLATSIVSHALMIGTGALGYVNLENPFKARLV